MQQFNDFLDKTLLTIQIPHSVIKYLKTSYQNDPYRILIELLLFCFMIWYVLMKKKTIGSNAVVLTEKEIDELCNEWVPEPLVPQLSEFQKQQLLKVPITTGQNGLHVKLIDGKDKLNFATFDFLGLLNREDIKTAAIEALKKYGVGTCGPRGFYGTIDVHLELEEKLAKFVGTESAIIYSQNYSTVSSAIPAFAKRGDVIVAYLFLTQ